MSEAATSAIVRKPVKSSQIKSVGYDPARKVLAVEFTHRDDQEQGSVYEYDNVDPDVAENMQREKDEDGKDWSIGSYFGKTLKKDPKRWPYRKISSAK